MIHKMKLPVFCAVFALVACVQSGPGKALGQMAEALEKHDSAAFLARIDMGAFAANHIKNMTENDKALSSLNAIGNLLGLGGLDRLLGSVMDMRSRMEQELTRGVASGELVAECRGAETPDCPWVPQSLRDAQIIEIGENAAIARVVTPAQMASWIALRKKGEKWLVVAQAVMESDARAYALGTDARTSAPEQGEPRPQQKRAGEAVSI